MRQEYKSYMSKEILACKPALLAKFLWDDTQCAHIGTESSKLAAPKYISVVHSKLLVCQWYLLHYSWWTWFPSNIYVSISSLQSKPLYLRNNFLLPFSRPHQETLSFPHSALLFLLHIHLFLLLLYNGNTSIQYMAAPPCYDGYCKNILSQFLIQNGFDLKRTKAESRKSYLSNKGQIHAWYTFASVNCQSFDGS